MRTYNLIWSFLFVLFAALQLNDPDPWIWMPLYLFAAALCGFRYAGKAKTRLEYTAVLIYITYAGLLLFTQNGVVDWYKDHDAESLVQSMKATKPWIENTREFGGLLIMVVVITINILRSRKK